MTRAMLFAIRLYPQAWRDRYGNEFAALLDETGPSPRDFANLLKGAFHMQLRNIGFWKLAASGAILGAAAFGAWAFTQPVRYVSTSVAAVNVTGPQEVIRVLNASFDREHLSEIIEQHRLYSGTTTTPEMVANMRKDINVGIIGRRGQVPGTGQSSAFTVTYRGADPKTAEAVNSALLTRLTRSLSAQSGPNGEPLTAVIIDPPSTPEHPLNKRVPAALAMGSVLGATLAALAYGLFRRVSLG